jgi:hypothetical protein
VVLPVEIFAANGDVGLICLCQPRGQPHKNTYVRISCGLSRSRKAELHCPSTFGMEGEHLLVEQQMSDLDADWGRDESAPNCSVYEHYVVSTCAVMFDCAQKCSDSS